jgi:L-alanine-DL-glutamate epimerase-like enolase superfamily enzyme
MSELLELRAHLLQLPLTSPYRLAFGDVTRFDVILVGVRDGEGKGGWGEATILPGYTDETVQQGWTLAREAVGTRRTAADLRAFASALLHEAPFTATAFLTALDWLDRDPILQRAGRVELLGTVGQKADRLSALEAEIEALLAAGYRTLKVKVGWEVEADLRQVRAVQAIVAGRGKLRIDGNQGYSVDQAVEFLKRLDPAGVELVEQPCAAGDWDAAVAAKRASAAPMMLDESIYGLSDIERAAALGCADYVKLKLMKLGSLRALEKGLKMIADLGMTPILGNGVASDLGCWMEACCALGVVDTAGEMNGFLKTPARLLQPALAMSGAELVIDGGAPTIDEQTVSAHAVDSCGSWRGDGHKADAVRLRAATAW